MYKPNDNAKGYIPSIENGEVIVRDYDGTPIVVAQGIVETRQGEAGKTFVLSPDAFKIMIEAWTRKTLEMSAEEANVALRWTNLLGQPIQNKTFKTEHELSLMRSGIRETMSISAISKQRNGLSTRTFFLWTFLKSLRTHITNA